MIRHEERKDLKKTGLEKMTTREKRRENGLDLILIIECTYIERMIGYD